MLASGLTPAFATINNTVTVKATPPGGPADSVTATANKSVDVQDAAPAITVVKSWTFAPGGDLNSNGLADAGDKIAYDYVVTNSGNVTLDQVTVSDAHQGVGAAPVILTPLITSFNNSVYRSQPYL